MSPPPTVLSITPNIGTDFGDDEVTIVGASFVAGASVQFGGVPATSVAVPNSTTITCHTPAVGFLGPCDVAVINPDLQIGFLLGGFTYVENPTIVSVTPAEGPYEGGTPITISGSAFAEPVTVKVGTNDWVSPLNDVVVVSPNIITAVTPSAQASGLASIVIEQEPGFAFLLNCFTYGPAPLIPLISIEPTGYIYDISGGVEKVASSSLALVHTGISGSINTRRSSQRNILDRLVVGRATRRETAQSPYDASLADPPSWTQVYAGKKHGFVISEISSSQHEVTSLNARVSGTQRLEMTAVPASGTLLYSKQNQLVTKVYKLTASLNLVPANDREPSTLENLARPTAFHSVSGSYYNHSMWNPGVLTIDVPDYGKIRDVKVWIEFVHDHRGGVGTGSANLSNPFWAGGSGSVADPRHGLQGVQLALRSPNTNFRYSHPLWNDPTVIDFEKMPDSTVSNTYRKVPDILTNSYLLWTGHAVEEDLGMALGNTTSSLPQAWNSSTVITGSVTNTYDISTMKLNGDNRPVIVYHHFDEVALRMRVPRLIGSTVTYVKENIAVDPPAGFGFVYAKLLLGSASCPHLFIGDDNDRLWFMRSSSLGWSSTSMTGTFIPIRASANDSAISSLDKIFVLGSSWFTPTTNLVTSSSVGGWQVERVVSPRQAVSVSIVADRNDKFHFSFIEQDDVTPFKYSMYYGTTGSAGFSIQKVDEQYLTSFLGTYTSLAVDSHGDPCIVYSFQSSVANGINITRSGSDGWTKRSYFTGSMTIDMASRNSRFDADDNLVSMVTVGNYRGASVSDLAMIRSGTNGLSLEFLPDSSVSAGVGGTLDLDTGANPHIVHQYSAAFGGITYMSRSFVEPRDGAYHEYDTDIDMRTRFTDSSRIPNPRHLEDLYANPSVSDFKSSGLQIERARKAGSYPSPLSSSVNLFNYQYFDTPFDQSAWLTGANFPWMLDGRIPPGNFQGRNWSSTSSLGVPPGWLTGPGNTAGVGEWPTTGSQIGPNDIKPVYPLLDDVYVEKVFYQSPSTSLIPIPSGSGRTLTGFRPGLRGTEIHGKWKLLIANNSAMTAGSPVGTARSGIWFRQLRLEFLIEQGNAPQEASFVSRNRKHTKTSYVPTRGGKRLVHIISGSSAWDIGTNAVYTIQRPEYGRSIGITSDRDDSSFAVYSRITGSLISALSASGKLEQVQASFLSNEFGTPYIPLSSGSGEQPDFDVYSVEDFQKTKDVFNTIFGRNTLIPADNTLRAHITRDDVFRTTRQIAEDAVNSTLSSSIG